MKLILDGKIYSADLLSLYKLSIAEIRAIKRHTGLTFADWKFGLVTYFREDPDILLGLVWLLKRRAGEAVSWDELEEIGAQDVVEGFDLEAVDQEQIEAAQAAQSGPEGAAAVDTPPPAGTTTPVELPAGPENPGA